MEQNEALLQGEDAEVNSCFISSECCMVKPSAQRSDGGGNYSLNVNDLGRSQESFSC